MPTRMRGCKAVALVTALFLLGVPVALRADSGALKVTSFPSGANVSVDGKNTGKVTPMSMSLSVGKHTVVVFIPNSGWKADTENCQIVHGDNNYLNVTLVPTTTTGPAGPPGPKGDPGPAGITNRGKWSSTTAYNKNDAVFDKGSYWLATAPNTNSEPSPTNTNWQILAAGINVRGAWQSTLNYNANDAVTDSGSFWLALVGNTNSEPSSSNLIWLLLAAKGAVGPAGPAGVPGIVGATGAAGPLGPPGPVGANGATGPIGPRGPVGVTGATGPIGPQGPVGATGAMGPIGPAGPAGATGATGSIGPQGPAGATGAMGPIGPAGPAGATGATGSIGPQGPAGATGAAGSAGPTGPQGPTGPTGPAGSAGANGISHAYMARNTVASMLTYQGINVVSLIVPAGTYVISGKTWLQNLDSLPGPASCTLSSGSDVTRVNLLATSQIGGDRMPVAVQDSATFTQITTIVFSCKHDDLNNRGMSANDAVLTVLAVDNLN